VPYQTWEEPMSAEDALNHGTIFTELNLPFLCVGGANYDWTEQTPKSHTDVWLLTIWTKPISRYPSELQTRISVL
jgi:hypothetical protein